MSTWRDIFNLITAQKALNCPQAEVPLGVLLTFIAIFLPL